jgi:hypothetical protein
LHDGGRQDGDVGKQQRQSDQRNRDAGTALGGEDRDDDD